ncbi:aminopeptidase N-like isoform X1 [Vanessa atalanta]|uniref:aminopeptidase N-like isoform X1 n=1 Tax=Vanessa atalanta TaxID=42275 RepID=UPI001FCCC7B1|nr:aminopeptidase N-like isoform X1 [Vanessa atalanta]XP_047528535.1 aminopeptidase N-like isoform X1 [Vanessa atalanta]
MSLSTSRQQFLAYESHREQDIQYGRKGGIFISTCICISFIIFAVLTAILVGIIVYYITYFRVSQQTEEYWDDAEPFGQSGSPSPDLRLPTYVVPSFYRLKIKADLENSSFHGDVYITIKANKNVKEIILHSKNLSINPNVTLTEQIYEKVETIHTTKKIKREVTNATAENNNATTVNNETFVFNNTEETLKPITVGAHDTTTTQPIDTQVTHSHVRNIKITSVVLASGDRLILSLASALTPDVDYTLQLSFDGAIQNSLTGFYKSTYTENNEVRQLGVTQFEPTSARAAFPCFDEPAFKAKFEISIGHRQNISVLSNMRVATQETIEEEPGWQWTHFERSVNMSTYLVAYVLSNFKNLETSYLSKDNVTKPIRIWTRPALLSKANYALTIVPKLLSFYEDVFGLPYALDKLDLIAIPDFSSGAMENWGLITFRETTLLFDEEEGIPREKQNVAIDIAHELAHQWFGNLVTMRWWNDLWLNEGFATYIEYIGVDHVSPAWSSLQAFTRDKMDLLRSDALRNTSPVSRRVRDAAEIAQKFDEISYSKGASLIRVLNHTLSADLFRSGLLAYLDEWKYQNAEENDLWNAMSNATKSDPNFKDLSVVEFMNTWTRQPGYPVVNVHRNYTTGSVIFQQKLFTSSEDGIIKPDRLWHIPISFTTLDTPTSNWTTGPKLWLKDRTITTTLPLNATQALYVNVDAIGYYRVNYDQRNWELLSAALKSGAVDNPILKAQLIDDAFNLAKVGQLNYSYALGLTTCVIDGEDSRIVWELLLNNMAFLKHNLRATSGYTYFQDYMNIILKKQLERLNYGLDQPKDDNESFLVENLVVWECLMESPRCLQWARRLFEDWTSRPDMNDNPIPNYLRSLVYNMAIKYGGRREFDLLWDMFENSTDPNVKSLIISNLPSTRDESLLNLLLERSLGPLGAQYATSAWGVEPPAGARAAQRFLRRHFARVQARFAAVDAFSLQAVLNGAFGFMTAQDELDSMKQFALKHKEELKPMSQTLQKIVDSATLRINWIKEYSEGINQWFKGYVIAHKANKSKTTTVSPGLTGNDTFINETETITTSSP